ncbi:MAG: hypothetical protein IJA60_03295 [Clostridia bacterium]|nr:hypothetical protein [Clostridia bacterium]
MKKRLQVIISLALAVCMALLIIPAFAKEAAEQITAVYRNIKLVVDGVLVEPKDANGNVVEPFIYNGTTYLPVRAVATAFEKDVAWDGENAIVYLGGKVDKPAKELTVWNRSYLECSNNDMMSMYEDNGIGYIKLDYRWNSSQWEQLSNGRFFHAFTVSYPVNTLAKTFSGTYYVEGGQAREGVLKVLNSNGKVLYQSPIMRNGVTPIDFEVNIENEIAIEIVIEETVNGAYSSNIRHYIKNPIFVSSDY